MKATMEGCHNTTRCVCDPRTPACTRPAIESLRVDTLVEPILKKEVEKEFQHLFEGLGRLHDNYQIKLKDDAQLFALTTPRRVAIPLLLKVKAELQRIFESSRK